MNQIVQQENRPTWPQLIDQVSNKFNEIASNQKLVTWAEESQFAIQAIQKNDSLAKCHVHTVQNSIINVAAIGLTLNPALGYAYLVPEKGECNLKVSFKGLLKIATDSGSIKWVKAEIVKANDKFTYRGACALPEHEMNPFGDRGATVGVYCVAKTFDGDYLVDVMSADEIAKIRKAAKQDYVWSAWPDEMAKKAIIKRASKQWPKTDRDDRLDRAIAVVNEYEGSEDIRHERDITPPQEPVKPAEKPFISNAGLNSSMAKIKAGELTIERLRENRQFTPEQSAKIDEYEAGAEWVDMEVSQ